MPRRLSAALILLTAVALPVNCDVLQVPEQPAATALPSRGMSMEAVEAAFGAPLEKIPAVGDPPISRWIYPDYVVFFEYDKVIHSVSTTDKDVVPAS